MRTAFGKACEAEERLNSELKRTPTEEIRDLVYLYAFNSNLEVPDDFDEQFERIRLHLNELKLYE
jgi:hypothetical protein